MTNKGQISGSTMKTQEFKEISHDEIFCYCPVQQQTHSPAAGSATAVRYTYTTPLISCILFSRQDFCWGNVILKCALDCHSEDSNQGLSYIVTLFFSRAKIQKIKRPIGGFSFFNKEKSCRYE